MTTPEFEIRTPAIPPPIITNKIAEAMVSSSPEGGVNRRWAVVEVVRDTTVDINLGGVTIEKIPRVAGYNPYVNDRVQVDVIGTDMIVIGPLAPSPLNRTVSERLAVVTEIYANGTLAVRFADNQVVGAYRVTNYFPALNDQVRVIQNGSDNDYLVVGTVASAANQDRKAIGDVELSIRKTPKPNTLFLNGQIVSRTTYKPLWDWVQAQGLVQTGLFTAGDGTTTFGLPDFRGRAVVGATTARDLGTLFGAAERVILPTNMARHTHQVSVRDHMSSSGQTAAEVGSQTAYHQHGGTTGAAGGNHGDHNHTNLTVAIGAAGSSYVLRTATTGFGNSAHSHGFGTGNDDRSHQHYLYIPPHAVTETAVGDNTPFNIEQPSISVNWLIWT